MSEKLELLKQLKAIEEKEFNEIIEANYPEFKKLEGKYFKYKNCYSCPQKKSDYWWLYSKVVTVEKENLYKSGENVLATCTCWGFQTDKNGMININPIYETYTHSLGVEISKSEFEKAWKATLNELSLLSF
jgi:hypothetical protein